MRTLVVIPAHDEEATVGQVVSLAASQGLEVLVVDDGSSDDTAAVARRAGALVMRLPINVGVGAALRCGFAFAHRRGYERVVQVDADLQHDPRRIPHLLQAAEQTGAQLLIGSRFAGQRYPISFTRRFLMRVLARYVNRLVHTQLDDVTSGFRVISQPLLSRFADAYPSDYLADTVEAILLAGQFGATIAQVPAAMSSRTAGRGTTGFQAAGYLLRTGLALAIGSWRTRTRELGR